MIVNVPARLREQRYISPVRRIGTALLTAALLTACGGSNSKAAERHVCGYLMSDAKGAVDSALGDIHAGNVQQSATDYATGADQLEKDVATLPAKDALRVTTEQEVAAFRTLAADLRSNGDLTASAKAIQAPGDAMETRCRAVSP